MSCLFEVICLDGNFRRVRGKGEGIMLFCFYFLLFSCFLLIIIESSCVN